MRSSCATAQTRPLAQRRAVAARSRPGRRVDQQERANPGRRRPRPVAQPPSGAASTPTRTSSRWPPTTAASSPPISRPSRYFPSEWGLHNTGQTLDGTEDKTGIADIDIDGLEALRITQGDPSIVVAVIDDGVDFGHPDLAGAAWTNPGEVAGNGLDDDGNGFADDIHGWDFCNGNASVHDAGQDATGRMSPARSLRR